MKFNYVGVAIVVRIFIIEIISVNFMKLYFVVFSFSNFVERFIWEFLIIVDFMDVDVFMFILILIFYYLMFFLYLLF